MSQLPNGRAPDAFHHPQSVVGSPPTMSYPAANPRDLQFPQAAPQYPRRVERLPEISYHPLDRRSSAYGPRSRAVTVHHPASYPPIEYAPPAIRAPSAVAGALYVSCRPVGYEVPSTRYSAAPPRVFFDVYEPAEPSSNPHARHANSMHSNPHGVYIPHETSVHPQKYGEHEAMYVKNPGGPETGVSPQYEGLVGRELSAASVGIAPRNHATHKNAASRSSVQSREDVPIKVEELGYKRRVPDRDTISAEIQPKTKKQKTKYGAKKRKGNSFPGRVFALEDEVLALQVHCQLMRQELAQRTIDHDEFRKELMEMRLLLAPLKKEQL